MIYMSYSKFVTTTIPVSLLKLPLRQSSHAVMLSEPDSGLNVPLGHDTQAESSLLPVSAEENQQNPLKI